MSITIVRTLPEEEWHRFVEEHPAGNIFHTPEMFQVFEQAKGHQPALWAATDDSDRLLALLTPVKVTLLGGLLTQLTSRSVIYGGVLCELTSDGRDALKCLLMAYN
ncbi:MAG TPA: GNAT family N-acetyltransferase, partial [Anaerolineae bacterium]|nr:GNAT family N-acetyltransferase [Anaerolineae bacterium]